LNPNFEKLVIEQQNEQSLAKVADYLAIHFPDKNALCKSINGGAAELSLMAAGHYYGTRAAFQQSQPEYEGQDERTIMYFGTIPWVTYSVTAKEPASPVLIALFCEPRYYQMICNALFAKNPFSGRFMETIGTSISTLYMFNTFVAPFRPVVLRLFREKSFINKHMVILLICLSNSVTSATSFLRRAMVDEEGFIANPEKEVTKKTEPQVTDEEKQFWRELGNKVIEFLVT
jgi:hypothetical protein